MALVALGVFDFIGNNLLDCTMQLSYRRVLKSNLLKLVNFCAAILILKMEENKQHFWNIMLYYFNKGKNATETQKKDVCSVRRRCGE